MPAGNVTAAVSGGTLSIIAVDKTAQADVLAGLNDQFLIITGAGAGAFTVAGIGATTVNGAASQSFINVTNIRADMRMGEDTVIVNKANLAGNLTFLGGGGNDNFTLGNVLGNQKLGSVTALMGEGNDFIQIGSGQHTITGALRIDNGTGDSNVTINLGAADELAVGSIKVTGGDGSDFLSVGGNKLTVAGAFAINNGVSAASITSLQAKTVTLLGALSITNLQGDDTIGLGAPGTTFTGKSVTINNGAGTTSTSFAANTNEYVGNVTIQAGDGTDITNFGSLAITGNLTVNTGPGTSNLTFGGSSSKVTGNVTLTNGVGFDTVQVTGATFEVTGALKVNNGSGGSTTKLIPTGGILIGGSTTITNSTGVDSVIIGNIATTPVHFHALSISNGEGGSTVTFNGPGTLVDGSLSVAGTEGSDTLTVNCPLEVKGSTSFSGGMGDSGVQFFANAVLEGAFRVTNLDGPDTLSVTSPSFTVDGPVSVNTGAGGASITFNCALVCAFHSAASITTAGGFDILQFGHISSRALALNTGNGTGMITFVDAAIISGNLSITAGDGTDLINFGGVGQHVLGSVTINTGIGDDLIGWAATASSHIDGALAIRMGDGRDQIQLSRLIVDGATSLDTGGMDDLYTLNDCLFHGAVSIVAGAGNDLVQIESLNTGIATSFDKAVTMNLGAGDDQVLIGLVGDADDHGEFSANLSMNGGAGLDRAWFLPPRSNVFAALILAPGVEVVL